MTEKKISKKEVNKLQIDLDSDNVDVVVSSIKKLKELQMTGLHFCIPIKILHFLTESKNPSIIRESLDYISELNLTKIGDWNEKQISGIYQEFLKDKTKTLYVRDSAAHGMALLKFREGIPIMKKILEEEKELMVAFPTFRKLLEDAIVYLNKEDRFKRSA